jgi:WD40 repeat protein/transcriptional regulator with XRE-family HTH domain
MSMLALAPNSFANFGDLLKYLRRRERLTQLELSITVGYSEAQISRLEQNQRLPDLAALKALFIPALHLGDEPELALRFLELAQSARQEDAPVPGVAPYKGLLNFEESDADLFFGRESLTKRLADRATALLKDAPRRFLAVVGASGSGKSSVVRAGLAVMLKRAGWDVRVFTPSSDPMRSLQTNVTVPKPGALGARLIVVDQFEEAFTLCHDEAQRVAFFEKLLSLAEEPTGRTVVVIALRADFYSRCSQYAALREAAAAEQEYIGQMTSAELRRAIEEPAKRGGWEFEAGLVDVLLNDIGAYGATEPEPGGLPLLSHALLATWERRRGRTFTMEGYRASGAVRGAIAETAESVFTDQLNAKQQELAREVFLRLTELGEGTSDTRRRATLTELVRQAEEATQLRSVLNMLADARLITLNEDTAEVAHEALTREWQRLHEWLTEDREGLRVHRHLTESAREWESRGREAGDLYRGGRLAQAREWALANAERLNESERGFLTASLEQEQHDVLEREGQRQRELEAAQKLAETQSHAARQLGRRAAFLTGAFALAIVFAGIALFFGSQANRSAISAQQNAERADANAKQAESQQRIATSRELAAAAISNLDADPERSILLALQAVNQTYATNHTVLPEAEIALHRAVQASNIELTLSGHTNTVRRAVFSPDGTRIATASADGTAKVWDAADGKGLLTIQASSEGWADSIAFSTNGKLLATAGDDKTTRIWDPVTGKELLTLKGHSDWVSEVAFSPDGSMLASSSADGTIKMWDVLTGKELLTLREEDNAQILSIAFSPDSTRIAAVANPNSGLREGWASIWNTSTGQKLLTLRGHTTNVESVAFSPDGARIVTAGDDSTAKVWDSNTGVQLLTLYGHTDIVWGAAFSPDGARIVTVGGDRQIKVWDALTGQELFSLAGHTEEIRSVAFSPDGTRIVTASTDKTAKVWSVAPSREFLTLVNGPPIKFIEGTELAYSPDGTRLATASSDLTPKVWDASNGKLLLQLIGHTDLVTNIAYSSDGTRITTASNDGTAKIWDAATGKELLTLAGHKDWVSGVAFSPDGSRLATGSFDKTAKIWNAQTGKELLTLVGHKDWILSVAFSPDGTHLATSSADGTAIVRDAATGKEQFTLNHANLIEQAVFSPDGTRVATASFDGTAKMWDAMTGKEFFTLSGHAGTLFDVKFSWDGRYLATVSVDETARIWDALTGKELLTLHAPASLTGVAFSPDGLRLAVGGRDGATRIYLLRIEDLIALAKSRLTRTLTTEECQEYLHMASCPASP